MFIQGSASMGIEKEHYGFSKCCEGGFLFLPCSFFTCFVFHLFYLSSFGFHPFAFRVILIGILQDRFRVFLAVLSLVLLFGSFLRRPLLSLCFFGPALDAAGVLKPLMARFTG